MIKFLMKREGRISALLILGIALMLIGRCTELLGLMGPGTERLFRYTLWGFVLAATIIAGWYALHFGRPYFEKLQKAGQKQNHKPKAHPKG